MKPGELIHVRRAAEILCCTPQHIYNMIQRDALDAINIGQGQRGLRVKKASVEKYIQNNKVNPEDYYK